MIAVQEAEASARDIIAGLIADLTAFQYGTDDEQVRKGVIEMLSHSIDQLQTEGESALEYLSTIEHGLRKQARKGETCTAFLRRTRRAIKACEARS